LGDWLKAVFVARVLLGLVTVALTIRLVLDVVVRHGVWAASINAEE
jgi:hypothetical protein